MEGIRKGKTGRKGSGGERDLERICDAGRARLRDVGWVQS